MSVDFLVEIELHYNDEAPETFGRMFFPPSALPKKGDTIMLRWLDGQNAFDVRVIDDGDLPRILHVSDDVDFLTRNGFVPPFGPYEPPVVTYAGNLRDLTQQVCTGHDEPDDGTG